MGGVVFDIGETLFDKTREFQLWARLLGIPAHTFSAVFGAHVAAGGGVADVLTAFAPGQDAASMYARLERSGSAPLTEVDLYPGARAALDRLRELGLRVGVAGNQPPGVGGLVRAMHLPADFVATSADWGLAKPDPEFFGRAARELGLPGEQVVYVGDQLQHDIVAARAAGLQTVRVLQGPWGYLRRDAAIEATCLAVVDRVAEVPDVLVAAGAVVA